MRQDIGEDIWICFDVHTRLDLPDAVRLLRASAGASSGGITKARKITGWRLAHYIKLVTHNPLGRVPSAACLQIIWRVRTLASRSSAGGRAPR